MYLLEKGEWILKKIQTTGVHCLAYCGTNALPGDCDCPGLHLALGSSPPELETCPTLYTRPRRWEDQAWTHEKGVY
jgi:hypothetical protein